MSDRAPHIDLLTGAFKRDHFEQLLAAAISRSRRAGQPLCLLHLDVDELQEHNDLQGRDALDVALGWLAAKVSAVIDGRGPIGRVGGDEFAVVLEGCTLDQACRTSGKLRKLVSQTLHASAFGDYRLTVSIGLAGLREGEPPGNLLEAAEAACRKAKQGGRDALVQR